MYKLLVALRRRNGMSHEEFSNYWLRQYGPLAHQMNPQIRRYIQNHAIRQTSGESYDGVAEEYYPDARAFLQMFDVFQSDAGKPLRDGMEKFLDTNGTMLLKVNEFHIRRFARSDVAKGRNMIKAVTFFKRREDVSLDHFCRYWHDNHAPLVLRVQPEIKKYIQNHSADPAQPFDGIAETWYENMEAFQRVFDRYRLPEGIEAKQNMERFADMSKTMNLLVVQKIIKA